MNTLAITRKQEITWMLVVTMFLTSWLAIPLPAKAGILQTAGKIAKTVTIQAGALAAGYMGGVLGIAVGMGPIGMAAGAIGGYIVGKKVMGWATGSVANVATIAGGVAGGLLVAGMGLPMLAVGVIGGALIGRGVAGLLKKLTGKASTVVQVSAGAVAAEDAKGQDFINHLMNRKTEDPAPAAVQPTAAETTAAPTADVSQDCYNKYMNAYKAYLDASQKGDPVAAQKCFGEYQKYLGEYQTMTKRAAGK